MLLAKEQETLKEIEMLEKHVMEQEKEYREQQQQLQLSLEDKFGNENTGDRKEMVRKRHMQMSKERGEQAASLKLTREKLNKKKKRIEDNLKQFTRMSMELFSSTIKLTRLS